MKDMKKDFGVFKIKKLLALALAIAAYAVTMRAQQQAAAAPARGQQPVVNTEIFLAPLDAKIGKIGAPLNISNSPDYDNQPSFTPDGKSILFTSKRDGKQTDIYRYDLAAKAVTQLTHTAESEYSPLVTPDGKTFSVIRVEADGTQRLWRFEMDGSNPRLVLENVKPVGYQCWIDATHVAVYVLGAGRSDPATLQVVDTATGTSKTLDSNIGHTLRIDPESHLLAYVKKLPSGVWQIEETDPAPSPYAYRLLTFLDGPITEDFAFTSSGAVLMSRGMLVLTVGTDLMKYAADSPIGHGYGIGMSPPPPAADFTNGPVKNITRMTVSPDGKWIAFVAEPVTK